MQWPSIGWLRGSNVPFHSFLVEIPQWESGRDRIHPWRTIQHLEQLRSHPRGIIHFRYYDVTSCDVTSGHVTSGNHATFGHEQWYIWYYYYSKKKGGDALPGMRRTYFRSRDFIPVRTASGDATSSNACAMARSPLLPLNYALSYPDIYYFNIWIWGGHLINNPWKIFQGRQSSCPFLAKLKVLPGILTDLSA
jgi:hypothetical protein